MAMGGRSKHRGQTMMGLGLRLGFALSEQNDDEKRRKIRGE